VPIPPCFAAHYEDDPDGSARAAAPGVSCCPLSAEAPSAGPNTPCLSLGGTDLGGCFETCVRVCLDSFTMAPYRTAVDANGCEAWVPDFPDTEPVVYCRS